MSSVADMNHKVGTIMWIWHNGKVIASILGFFGNFAKKSEYFG